MASTNNEIITDVATYYGERIAEHGQTAAGVDWNSQEGQITRFNQLLKLVDPSKPYSIADIGCGYGALLDYLSELGHTTRYVGVDVSAAMIDAARSRHSSNSEAEFKHGTLPEQNVDYSVASGIFNVRLNKSEDEWLPYVLQTIDAMHSVSDLGFAFNCLTSYSDLDRKRPDLYYANPLEIFDLCKRRFSPHVALYHDYKLYEFTIIVRR